MEKIKIKKFIIISRLLSAVIVCCGILIVAITGLIYGWLVCLIGLIGMVAAFQRQIQEEVKELKEKVAKLEGRKNERL